MYTCRKCGIHVRKGSFDPLKLCNVCSSSIVPEDKAIVQEFSNMLKEVGNAKTPRERAQILLRADDKAREKP